MQFLQALVNRAKVRKPHVRVGPMGQVVEGGGHANYAPQAAAQQDTNTMLWNADPVPGDPHYRDFVVAHELGHLAQRQLMPGEAQTDQYLDATHQARSPVWMQHNPQGRAEVRTQGPRALLHEDRFGMPWSGPGSLHSSAGEQYANDFAASLAGKRIGHERHPSMTGSHYVYGAGSEKVLATLRKLKLLPQNAAKKRDQG
jgi:hypothetical protein